MHMLDQVPKGGVLCELGTQRGLFAKEIIARTAPRELHLVDITFELCDADLLKLPIINAHEMMTTAYLATAPDAHFDMIYVDADHSYEAVRDDAEAAMSKVKPIVLTVVMSLRKSLPFTWAYPSGVNTRSK